ncbi:MULTISPECIES: error-prone DNA polymerase [Actinomyces]|uniref:Error-prone DNA polymerase n=1 Tax=Actinomyces respiraculi TaxID=2744574 RepID=A0A7T0LJ20_9ACTO|nr:MULTISPECIES: error-prone DNA polymerase [Actinomyces]QPL04515.1 error-prone DNA polymerase [Actinomyces respiraculi]
MFDSCAVGEGVPRVRAHRYAELHAHSAYSFLDGANEPEDLAAAAVALGLEALALTDHDGMPGIVKHAEAGRRYALPTIHGTELTLEDGSHLPVLARSPLGYRRLCAAVSRHNLDAGQRAEPAHRLADLATALREGYGAAVGDTTGSRPGSGGATASPVLVLTGTANGPLRRALGDPRHPGTWNHRAADAVLGHLVELFGTEGVAVEITLDGGPTDAALTKALSRLAATHRLPLLATGAVRCARPADARLADVLTATRLCTDLEGARSHLPALGRWLRGPDDMARLHRRAPQAVDATAEIATDLAFDLSLVAPDLPAPEVPEGHTPASWLRELTYRGALRCYGTAQQDPRAWQVLAHELEVIESLDFPGYFLIVRSVVDFCEQAGILCQGRGSAANSAVCYALGITAVDAVRHQMLFERFLSPGRSGYPDIDLDIEACRREEVIQHVYARYGRDYAAQVANVISYRSRSAVRDAARALGHPPGVIDAWTRSLEHRWSPLPEPTAQAGADEPPEQVRAVANRLLLLPRHLGIHSGGMVLAAQPVTEVCPVRWAAMEGRTVLQWDKDDCAAAGLVKFDLLGLGMLTALRLAFTTLAERGETVPEPLHEDGAGTLRPAQSGRPWGLHTLPEEDPAVYRLLSAADTIGVFQVESRAQMATLPRLRPSTFYDIVVEVALIRPGPIQGDAVNPYLRRRLGEEPVTYPHPLLEPALSKTLGVPLFQEQLMQIAVDTAGFSPAEADALRQAMGSKRSRARMEALHTRLVEGMGQRGIDRSTAEAIYDKLCAFSDFGFPESHAFSFAYLVYASAWLKVRRPEDFYAGVLAAQPMGFWSPQTLVGDARRHGVRVEPADVNRSGVQAGVERIPDDGVRPAGPTPYALSPLDVHPELAVRLGLAPVKGIGARAAEEIVSEREAHGAYRNVADLARRVRLSRARLENLAAAGALASLGMSRREALWSAGALAGEHGTRHTVRLSARPAGGHQSDGVAGASAEQPAAWYQPTLPGTTPGVRAPQLRAMSAHEEHVADLRLTGVSAFTHPLAFLRPLLQADGVMSADALIRGGGVLHGHRVRAAGVITHRQRPHTAAGTIFLNLEDETGLLNVICSAGMWKRYRGVGRRAAAVVVTGSVESADGVTAVRADRLEALGGVPTTGSRDWA